MPFGPDSDGPAHCYSNALFVAPAGNVYGATYYGTAAISRALGGGDWLASGCGKCWKVTGTSNIPPHNSTTTVILKGANYCPPVNDACSNGKAHFDIAAPGFDVLNSSLSNTCLTREPNEAAGFASCEYWMIKSDNPEENCDCSVFNSEVLRAGCENFRSLYWNNIQVTYEEVLCPIELARLSCWEENGNAYPDNIPEFCASNAWANMCCSWDYKTCANSNPKDYCNQNEQNCHSCGGGLWLEEGSCTGITKYGDCTNNRSGCCAPAICKDQGSYFQCL
jgi:hypothetical protein